MAKAAKKKPKIEKTTTKSKIITPADAPKTFAAFYSGALDDVEKKTRTYSNSLTFTKRLSTGILVYDWITGGGILPGMCSIAGPEASGKTTAIYHSQASAINAGYAFNGFWDAERTLNPQLAGRIWEPFGLDIQAYLANPERGFRYYREHVIEKFADFMVNILDKVPNKVYEPDAKSWAYVIPKRDDYFKRMMQALGLKPDKSLSTEHAYYCLTDNDRPEGFMALDSFAAMLTNDTEEKQERSNRRAEEASAFSAHLKRFIGKVTDKQWILNGTNQVRLTPGQTYGDPEYEPGGGALQFYSSMRSRIRSKAVPTGYDRSKENGSLGEEKSVEGSGVDKYMYKKIKNTKNKYGVPGLTAEMRVWVSDRNGNPRGFDPAYDVFQHLLNTKQVIRTSKGLKFKLKDSVGKAAAGMLNEANPVKFDILKQLVLAETTGRTDLLKKAAKALGINKNPKLRERLFNQMQVDSSLYQLHADMKEKKETDYEAEEL